MKKIILGVFSSIVFLSGLFATTSFAASGSDTLPSGIRTSDIGNRIEEYYKEHEETAAGMMVAVFDGDEIFYEGYYGMQNKEEGLPVNSDTVMEWGSISKLLVWVSAMQLHEQGLIDFDTDIREYLPEGFLRRLQYDDKITMINLMNHDAGFQESLMEMQFTDINGVLSLEEYLRVAEPYQIFRPGEVVAYSNWSTSLAAYIVELVSGMPYVDYVHANIFEPLGMNLSALAPDLSDNAEVRKRWENLNYYNADGSFLSDAKLHITCFPSGMCTSTLTDLTTFCQAFITRDTRLMSADSFEEFLTPTKYYGDNAYIRNAHGMWALEFGVVTLGHGGNTSGSSSYLLFADNGIGYVVMTNQPNEQEFNWNMPELVYGTYEGDERLANVEMNGVVINSRTVFEGPLKVIKMAFILPLSSAKNTAPLSSFFAVQNGDNIDIETQDYIKADMFSLCAEILVVALYAITVICSAIMLLIGLVRRIIKKPGKNSFHKWNILTAAVNILSLVPLCVLIFSVASLTGMYHIGKYRVISGSIILIMIAWVSLLIFKFTHKEKSDGKASGFINLMTVIGIISCIAFSVVEQTFMFWRL